MARGRNPETPFLAKEKKSKKLKDEAQPLIIPKTPDELSDIHIQSIGQRYKDLHGETSSGWYSLHKSHSFANALQKYSCQDQVDDRWKYLANFYITLPGHQSEIATNIRKFFESAFGTEIQTITKISSHEKAKTMLEVSKNLQNISNGYFVDYYKNKYLQLPAENLQSRQTSMELILK